MAEERMKYFLRRSKSIVEPQFCGAGMRKKEQKQAEHAGRGREVVGSWRILRSRLNTTEVRGTRKRVEKSPLPDRKSGEDSPPRHQSR